MSRGTQPAAATVLLREGYVLPPRKMYEAGVAGQWRLQSWS